MGISGAAIAIMTIGTIIFEVIPDKVFLLFDASEHMLNMGVAAFCIITGSLLQAVGNAYQLLNS